MTIAYADSTASWSQSGGPCAMALADHEMLEIVLFRSVPRKTVRRLAREAMARFGSFAEVVAAPPQRLNELAGMTSGAIAELKFVEAAVHRVARGVVQKRLPLGSWSEVVDYCRVVMAFERRESCRVLFLDKKNGLIADEVQAVGAIDEAPIYPREVIRRALELSAAAIVLVHNHPSGDPAPSPQDIRVTLDIIAIAAPLGLAVHDHIIVSREGHSSLRELDLI